MLASRFFDKKENYEFHYYLLILISLSPHPPLSHFSVLSVCLSPFLSLSLSLMSIKEKRKEKKRKTSRAAEYFVVVAATHTHTHTHPTF